jgi:hypothetical protein
MKKTNKNTKTKQKRKLKYRFNQFKSIVSSRGVRRGEGEAAEVSAKEKEERNKTNNLNKQKSKRKSDCLSKPHNISAIKVLNRQCLLY